MRPFLTAFALIASAGCDHSQLLGTRTSSEPPTGTPDSGVDAGAPDAGRSTVDPTERSGSRVKIRWWTAQDGTVLWRDEMVHDSEKDVDCTIERAEDGQLRCLPTGAAGSYYIVNFLDDQCTKPVVAQVGLNGPVGCSQ